MAGLRDMFQRAFGGQSPEEALTNLKERLHQSLNEFKDDAATQEKVRQNLQSIKTPLRYFNLFVVRPHLDEPERLKALAQRYQINKIDMKRLFKTALELEDSLEQYFGDTMDFDQLVIVLRRVLNLFDEQLVVDALDAFDSNIDYSKIEKAYLDYQDKLSGAYNVMGLNRDLKNVVDQFVSGFRNVVSTPHKIKTRPSDQDTTIKMLPVEFQRIYDHYIEEGYTHEEANLYVRERQDLAELNEELLEAYRVLRQEGRSHADAIAYIRNLKDKITG